MADRVLRGSRLGSTSYEADRNHDLAPRRTATYRCPRDHEFTVPMADDAEVPAVWDCRMHGLASTLIDGSVPEGKASSRRAPTGTCCWSVVPSRSSKRSSTSGSPN